MLDIAWVGTLMHNFLIWCYVVFVWSLSAMSCICCFLSVSGIYWCIKVSVFLKAFYYCILWSLPFYPFGPHQYLLTCYFTDVFMDVNSLINLFVIASSFMSFSSLSLLSFSLYLHSSTFILSLSIQFSAVSLFCLLSIQYWSESVISLCCGLKLSLTVWNSLVMALRDSCSVCIGVCMNQSSSFLALFLYYSHFSASFISLYLVRKMLIITISKCFSSKYLSFDMQLNTGCLREVLPALGNCFSWLGLFGTCDRHFDFFIGFVMANTAASVASNAACMIAFLIASTSTIFLISLSFFYAFVFFSFQPFTSDTM